MREGKNKNDRNVPIARRTLDWVERYLKELRPCVASLASGEALFLTDAGQRVEPHKVTDMVTKCVNHSGIDKKGACHLGMRLPQKCCGMGRIYGSAGDVGSQ